MLYDLAALLHKTVSEIESMSANEFWEWQAWWRIRNDRSANKLDAHSHR